VSYNAVQIMTACTAKNPGPAIGRNPDRLTLDERTALAGKWIAMEVYSPATLPFRRIEAIGDTVADCVRILQERGLDPAIFEFSRLAWPY
jgi:hypothetical protein